MAHGEPELGVVSTQRNEPFGCASEGGDFDGCEEREDAELDILREIGEGNGTNRFACSGIRHFL